MMWCIQLVENNEWKYEWEIIKWDSLEMDENLTFFLTFVDCIGRVMWLIERCDIMPTLNTSQRLIVTVNCYVFSFFVLLQHKNVF